VIVQAGSNCDTCNGVQFSLGDVDGDGKITIADAVQVLRFLAGMTNVIYDGAVINQEYNEANIKCRRAWNAARISREPVPSIDDVLDILKYLAGMENRINNSVGGNQ
jgi:hypothetical protein